MVPMPTLTMVMQARMRESLGEDGGSPKASRIVKVGVLDNNSEDNCVREAGLR